MRASIAAAYAGLLSVAFASVLKISALGDGPKALISDSGQLLAAVAASAGCWVAASRSEGRRRVSWRWLSAGTGCWAAGQAVWSYYELILHTDVPFPSLADVGFLLFPIVGGVGLLTWSGAQSHEVLARGRDLLDGAIIATSLLVLSWVTIMAHLVQMSGGFGFSLLLSLAYPLGDVVLGTLVLITVFRSRDGRQTLTLLALGVGGFALADSLFVYLTASGTYSSADMVSSSGWVFGFLFVAASGMSVGGGCRPVDSQAPRLSQSSWLWMALPYLPLVGAGAAVFIDLLQAGAPVLADLVLGVALVVLMMSRQFLSMVENQRLLLALAEAGGLLEHQAMHDALTGLPNRVLFAKRLDRALLSSSSNVTVLFCDLDDFKPVNDELGHAAGDMLLKTVAERLVRCVRPHDTVARLGGDEFAIVLQDCPDAREVADRIVSSVDAETMIMGHPVRVSISVGLAHHEATRPGTAAAKHRGDQIAPGPEEVPTRETDSGREVIAALLIRLADTAMYAAKSAGKGRTAFLDADPVLATAPAT